MKFHLSGNLTKRHQDVFYKNPLFTGMKLPNVRTEQTGKNFKNLSSKLSDLITVWFLFVFWLDCKLKVPLYTLWNSSFWDEGLNLFFKYFHSLSWRYRLFLKSIFLTTILTLESWKMKMDENSLKKNKAKIVDSSKISFRFRSVNGIFENVFFSCNNYSLILSSSKHWVWMFDSDFLVWRCWNILIIKKGILQRRF